MYLSLFFSCNQLLLHNRKSGSQMHQCNYIHVSLHQVISTLFMSISEITLNNKADFTSFDLMVFLAWLIWCIRYSITAMQSHRSLDINKHGDLIGSFLSEQSVRDVLLLDRLVLSWLSDMSHCLKRYQTHKEPFIGVIRTFNNLM